MGFDPSCLFNMSKIKNGCRKIAAMHVSLKTGVTMILLALN